MMPRPGHFAPRKEIQYPFIGSWVGPRVGLDRCRKSHPHLDLIPRTVQPIASSTTDYDNLATPTSKNVKLKNTDLEHK
jgi:hypothetical protein